MFFAEVGKENAGRAVRREPPRPHALAAVTWRRLVESLGPRVELAAPSGSSLGRGRGSGRAGGFGSLPAAGRGGAGVSGGGAAGGPRGAGNSGGPGPGQAGRPGQSAAAARVNRAGAKVQGVPVCYAYNSLPGCSRARTPHNSATCMDGNGAHFAHFCNYLDLPSGTFCLQAHSRVANH